MTSNEPLKSEIGDIFPQTKEARLGWGSYLACREVPLQTRISRRRRLAYTCLDLPSPARNSLPARISRRRRLAYTCLDLPSPAPNSL